MRIYTKRESQYYHLNASAPNKESNSCMKYSGEMGSHMGANGTVKRAFRQGFYWPTTVSDAQDIITKCQHCQMFSPHSSRSANKSSLICPTWPLQRWGIYIVGSLPAAPGNLWLAVVASNTYKMDRMQSTSKDHFQNSQKFAYNIAPGVLRDSFNSLTKTQPMSASTAVVWTRGYRTLQPCLENS